MSEQLTFTDYVNMLLVKGGWKPASIISDTLVKFRMGLYEEAFRDTVYIELIENKNGDEFFNFRSWHIPVKVTDEDPPGYADFLSTLPRWCLERSEHMMFGHWTLLDKEESGLFFTVVTTFDADTVNVERLRFGIVNVLGEIANFRYYMNQYFSE